MGRCLLFLLFFCFCGMISAQTDLGVYLLIGSGSYKGVYACKPSSGFTKAFDLVTPYENAQSLTVRSGSSAGQNVLSLFSRNEGNWAKATGSAHDMTVWIDTKGKGSGGEGDYWGAHAYHHAYHSVSVSSPENSDGSKVTLSLNPGTDGCYPHSGTGTMTAVSPSPVTPPSQIYNAFVDCVDGTAMGKFAFNDGRLLWNKTPSRGGWYKIPNGSWYHCGFPSKNDANTAGASYYAMYQVKWIKSVDIKKYETTDTWNSWPSPTPVSIPSGDQNFNQEAWSYGVKNGCHDGCFSGASPGASTFVDKHVQMISSTRTLADGTSRSVQYMLTQNKDVHGVIDTTNPPVMQISTIPANYPFRQIPASVAGAYKDSTHIGASLQIDASGNKGDYFYVLGANLINHWLSDYSYNVSVIGDVAVADVWRGMGGVIYVYENGKITRITRDEKTGTGTIKSVSQFSIATSADEVDALSADGQGNLYFCKTHYDPPKFSSIVNFDQSYVIRYTEWTDLYTGGMWSGQAILRRPVSKTVFKYDVTASANIEYGQKEVATLMYKKPVTINPSSVPGTWQLSGSNIIDTSTGNPVPKSALNAFVYTNNIPGDLNFSVPEGSEDTSIPGSQALENLVVELAVINNAGAPEVTGFPARIDIDKPKQVVGTGLQDVTEGTAGGSYEFRIENAVNFNSTLGINASSNNFKYSNQGGLTDSNGNNYVGGFPSTIAYTTTASGVIDSVKVNYKFALISPSDPSTLIEIPGDPALNGYQSTPNFRYNFDVAGDWTILATARYQFYDYHNVTTWDAGKSESQRVECKIPAGVNDWLTPNSGSVNYRGAYRKGSDKTAPYGTGEPSIEPVNGTRTSTIEPFRAPKDGWITMGGKKWASRTFHVNPLGSNESIVYTSGGPGEIVMTEMKDDTGANYRGYSSANLNDYVKSVNNSTFSWIDFAVDTNMNGILDPSEINPRKRNNMTVNYPLFFVPLSSTGKTKVKFQMIEPGVTSVPASASQSLNASNPTTITNPINNSTVNRLKLLSYSDVPASGLVFDSGWQTTASSSSKVYNGLAAYQNTPFRWIIQNGCSSRNWSNRDKDPQIAIVPQTYDSPNGSIMWKPNEPLASQVKCSLIDASTGLEVTGGNYVPNVTWSLPSTEINHHSQPANTFQFEIEFMRASQPGFYEIIANLSRTYIFEQQVTRTLDEIDVVTGMPRTESVVVKREGEIKFMSRGFVYVYTPMHPTDQTQNLAYLRNYKTAVGSLVSKPSGYSTSADFFATTGQTFNPSGGFDMYLQMNEIFALHEENIAGIHRPKYILDRSAGKVLTTRKKPDDTYNTPLTGIDGQTTDSIVGGIPSDVPTVLGSMSDYEMLYGWKHSYEFESSPDMSYLPNSTFIGGSGSSIADYASAPVSIDDVDNNIVKFTVSSIAGSVAPFIGYVGDTITPSASNVFGDNIVPYNTAGTGGHHYPDTASCDSTTNVNLCSIPFVATLNKGYIDQVETLQSTASKYFDATLPFGSDPMGDVKIYVEDDLRPYIFFQVEKDAGNEIHFNIPMNVEYTGNGIKSNPASGLATSSSVNLLYPLSNYSSTSVNNSWGGYSSTALNVDTASLNSIPAITYASISGDFSAITDPNAKDPVLRDTQLDPIDLGAVPAVVPTRYFPPEVDSTGDYDSDEADFSLAEDVRYTFKFRVCDNTPVNYGAVDFDNDPNHVAKTLLRIEIYDSIGQELFTWPKLTTTGIHDVSSYPIGLNDEKVAHIQVRQAGHIRVVGWVADLSCDKNGVLKDLGDRSRQFNYCIPVYNTGSVRNSLER